MTKINLDQHAQIHKRSLYILETPNHSIELGRETKIMGIVNLTPDSFSGDGLDEKRSVEQKVRYAQSMIRQGADILDLGGESSRPGAKRITVKEEMDRVIPTLKALRKKTDIPLSVDTYKPTVARAALDEGASIINNIRGTQLDRSLLKLISSYKASIVLMHMRKNPKTMQNNIHYNDVVCDIIAELKEAIAQCYEAGIKDNQIVIDPGIGFGKTMEHNLEILQRLEEFSQLNLPILMGTSRKSFIGQVLNQTANQRLFGTMATLCASIQNGAHIMRVHDVKETRQTVDMVDAILNI